MADPSLRRVVVVGAGFFGTHVARRLRDAGVPVLVAARSHGDARVDVERDDSLRSLVREGDVIVDTAGPHAHRTTRLLEAAIELGCDVIDIAESLAWSDRVLALRDRVARAGVRVYPACSAVAAVTGACVVASAIATPDRVDQFLAPAGAETASPATVRGFVASLGRPMRMLRTGRAVTVRGYAARCAFPSGRRRGGRVESAATALLPLAWPSLRDVDFWVDPNVPLGCDALSLVARLPPLAAVARALLPRVPVRRVGRHDGTFAVRVADATHAATFTFTAPRGSYLIAVTPAVLVADALARGATPPAGVVLPNAVVEPDVLFARLRSFGISVEQIAR